MAVPDVVDGYPSEEVEILLAGRVGNRGALGVLDDDVFLMRKTPDQVIGLVRSFCPQPQLRRYPVTINLLQAVVPRYTLPKKSGDRPWGAPARTHDRTILRSLRSG